MDFNAFSHGQVQSKQWLCEILEPYIPHGSSICILGCWYNILGLMLLTRNPHIHHFIKGIDIDVNAISIADKICQAYTIQPMVKISNEVADANLFNLNGYNVVINCSLEHMSDDLWFKNISNGTLVCLQTSNVNINDSVWDIKNHIPSMEVFYQRFPLSHCLFKNTKQFDYGNLKYERYMLVGLK